MRQKLIIYAHQPIIRIMCTAMFGALTVPGAGWAQTLADDSIESLQRLSIEELANLQVTSVSKIPESLHEAPAAVYVITHDDIIRSGCCMRITKNGPYRLPVKSHTWCSWNCGRASEAEA